MPVSAPNNLAVKMRDDESGDDAGQPGARIDAAVMRGEQQLQVQHQRQHLGDRKDGHPLRGAVVNESEEGQAGKAGRRGEQGTAPRNRPVEELPDPHRGQTDRQYQRGAGEQ